MKGAQAVTLCEPVATYPTALDDEKVCVFCECFARAVPGGAPPKNRLDARRVRKEDKTRLGSAARIILSARRATPQTLHRPPRQWPRSALSDWPMGGGSMSEETATGDR